MLTIADHRSRDGKERLVLKVDARDLDVANPAHAGRRFLAARHKRAGEDTALGARRARSDESENRDHGECSDDHRGDMAHPGEPPCKAAARRRGGRSEPPKSRAYLMSFSSGWCRLVRLRISSTLLRTRL